MKPTSCKTITQQFGIPEADFERTGALNSVLNIDSKLFLDPALLRQTKTAAFSQSYEKVLETFKNVFILLKHSHDEEDPFWKAAAKLLYGKEIRGLCIGYSHHGTAGSGFGSELIKKILSCGKSIIEAGLEDPEIFELVGLIEDKVGPDRISDLICQIIAEDIYRYSEDIFSQFDIPKKSVVYQGNTYCLPINEYNGESIKVLPKGLLSDLPMCFDWTHYDVILRHNQELRNSLNHVIGDTWRDAAKMSKPELKSALLENTELLRDLVDSYKKKNPHSYDFVKDPAGQIIWKTAADLAVSRYPLQAHLSSSPTPEEVRDVVRIIVEKFKDLVENNGMWSLVYKDDVKPKYESASQLLFFGVADSYCDANNIDLVRECNAGRGPVDFKYSQGYRNRVLVELKLSSNTALEKGFSTQIAEYEKAEKTQFSICVVIHVLGGSRERVNKLADKVAAMKKAGQRCPDLYIIDAIPKDSASKFKL